MTVEFIADIDTFNRGLRKLDRELQKETRRRMAAISRRERDRIRGDMPVGPAAGGHAFRAVRGVRGPAPS